MGTGKTFTSVDARQAYLQSAIKAVDAAFVNHTPFKRIFDEMMVIIDLGRSDGEAPCLCITGPPGVGKTTLRRKLAQKFPRSADKIELLLPRAKVPLFVRLVPVVIVEMPDKPTRRKLIITILIALGDPDPTGETTTLEQRLDRFISACEPRAIVIDEAQRVIDRGGVVISEEVAELLKAIHGKYGMSMFLIGLGRVVYLFQNDDQLSDRWDSERRLDPYSLYKDVLEADGTRVLLACEPSTLAFRSILKNIEQVAALPMDGNLWAEDMTFRIWYASQGKLRGVKRLLKRSLLNLLADEARPVLIGMEELSEAFVQVFRNASRLLLNPFVEDFVRQLPPALEDDRALRVSPAERLQKRGRQRGAPAGAKDLVEAMAGR